MKPDCKHLTDILNSSADGVAALEEEADNPRPDGAAGSGDTNNLRHGLALEQPLFLLIMVCMFVVNNSVKVTVYKERKAKVACNCRR